jgi:FtsZ-interacting cell division protein YlmF
MEINKINQRVLINSKSNKYAGYSKEEDTFERSRNEDKGIYKPVVFHRKKQANPGENNNISQTEIPKEIKSLNIIYTNDIHGAIAPEKFDKKLNTYTGGMAYMGTVIKELKKETEGKNLLPASAN